MQAGACGDIPKLLARPVDNAQAKPRGSSSGFTPVVMLGTETRTCWPIGTATP